MKKYKLLFGLLILGMSISACSKTSNKIVVPVVQNKLNETISSKEIEESSQEQINAAIFTENAKLTWKELKQTKNGEKFGYDASAISDTTIGMSAFENCNDLLSIKISDGITTIDNSAFYGCRSLMAVEIPDSVTNINEGAFANCGNLLGILLPSQLLYMGEGVFENTNIVGFVYKGEEYKSEYELIKALEQNGVTVEMSEEARVYRELSEYFDDNGRFIYADKLNLFEKYKTIESLSDKEILEQMALIDNAMAFPLTTVDHSELYPTSAQGAQNIMIGSVGQIIADHLNNNGYNIKSYIDFRNEDVPNYADKISFWEYIKDCIKDIPYDDVKCDEEAITSWEDFIVWTYEKQIHTSLLGEYLVFSFAPRTWCINGDFDDIPEVMDFVELYNQHFYAEYDRSYPYYYWMIFEKILKSEIAVEKELKYPKEWRDEYKQYVEGKQYESLWKNPYGEESKLWRNYQAFLNLSALGNEYLYDYFQQSFDIEQPSGNTITIGQDVSNAPIEIERREFQHFSYQEILDIFEL